MDASLATDAIAPTIGALNAAWNRADGAGFAAKCTADVDFINLLGMYVKGRTAVAAVHEKILHGPYAGSTLEFTIERVRVLSADAVLALVPGHLQIPAGPVKGVLRTIATVLFVREGSEWLVASFQNTKQEATAANLTDVMVETLTKKA